MLQNIGKVQKYFFEHIIYCGFYGILISILPVFSMFHMILMISVLKKTILLNQQNKKY